MSHAVTMGAAGGDALCESVRFRTVFSVVLRQRSVLIAFEFALLSSVGMQCLLLVGERGLRTAVLTALTVEVLR